MSRNEYAVIGLGRFGSNVAMTLEEYGHQVLGIDESAELVQKYSSRLTQAVILDSSNIEALKEVDIMSFDTVVVAIGTDFEANIMTTVSLKELGVRQVICKAQTAQQERILLKVGADQVVRPEREAGIRLAHHLINPSEIESFALGTDTDYRIAEFSVPRIFCNQSLTQSNIRGRFNTNILVIKRGDEVIVNPPANAILQKQDVIVMLGHEEDLHEFSLLE